MESLTYIISDQVDFSRLVSHRYPTNLFMSISWRAIPSAVRKQSVCSLGSDLADVCNSNWWNYTELLPLPVQALSCGYSRFYHQADTLPSQQLSPSDPLGCERTIPQLRDGHSIGALWLFPSIQLFFWHHSSLASYITHYVCGAFTCEVIYTLRCLCYRLVVFFMCELKGKCGLRDLTQLAVENAVVTHKAKLHTILLK